MMAVLEELWVKPDAFVSLSEMRELLREEMGLRADGRTYQLRDL